jgi:uncharacterized protein DUF4136
METPQPGPGRGRAGMSCAQGPAFAPALCSGRLRRRLESFGRRLQSCYDSHDLQGFRAIRPEVAGSGVAMKRLMILLGCIALAATQARAVSVKENFNKETDFSKYKTFTLKPGTLAKNPFAQQRIEKAIIAQLTEKGLTQGGEGADLILYTHAKISVEKALDVSSFGYGGYYGWGGWGGDFGSTSVNVVDVPMGTLMVDMVDGSSKEMVWRGIAQGTVPTSSTSEESEKRINKAVAKLFRNFPPKAKK